MSYAESRSWTSGWRLVVGLIIFMVVLSMFFGRSHPVPSEQVAAALASSPHIRESEAVLQDLYPAEHGQMVAQLAETIRQGGNQVTLNADRSTFIDGLLRRRAYAIANAPDAAIRAIAGADLAAARALQRSEAQLCADFLGRGMADDSHPSDEAEALLDHGMALRLRAAHDGETSRQPPRPSPTREDNIALLALLRARHPATAALLRAGGSRHAPPAEQCAAGIGLYEAALALPAGQGERILANIYRAALTGS